MSYFLAALLKVRPNSAKNNCDATSFALGRSLHSLEKNGSLDLSTTERTILADNLWFLLGSRALRRPNQTYYT
jgi:hypothetical protein